MFAIYHFGPKKLNFPEGIGGGGGGYHFLEKKMENPGSWVLSELPCMVRVWIFSGTTH